MFWILLVEAVVMGAVALLNWSFVAALELTLNVA